MIESKSYHRRRSRPIAKHPHQTTNNKGGAPSLILLLFILYYLSLSTITTITINAQQQQEEEDSSTLLLYPSDDNNPLFTKTNRVIVTNQAMGARCAVSADFDGDGLQDIVSASSNDNAVSWFRNLGGYPTPTFSIKNEITWSSLGSRIVTVGDVDGDGDVDVVGTSYYDSSLRWFENDGTGVFNEHLISSAVNEGQGVILADLDNDGDPDIVSASSGDNTIAVFRNMDHGIFCEVKEVVDDDAKGARTVIAADLNGDGWLDLASASKDDDSVSWYPNDGTGHFHEKIVISRGEESKGAYSLVAVDIDEDGDQDLVVASNGNDHVSVWRNNGDGSTFTKTLIYDNADFVLSVTAVDFDRDGDIDVASASFFDGHINWYENIDGEGYVWKNHTIYTGTSDISAGGHYVSHGDMDGDGDYDLIAVTNAENTVAVYFAATECDDVNNTGAECCITGSKWNGTDCEFCDMGEYGVGIGVDARCLGCPVDQCTIPGLTTLPPTCGGITGCIDADTAIADCTIQMDYNYLTTIRGFGLFLCAIAMSSSLACGVWTQVHRKHRVVIASQPFFLRIICIGCLIMASSIIPLSIDDSVASPEGCSKACMAFPWLLSIGFTTTFAALFSKTWRLNKVMSNARRGSRRGIRVKEKDVILPFAILMTINVSLMAMWTSIDPRIWVRTEPNEQYESHGYCEAEGQSYIAFLVFIGIVNASALVLATIQAYRARNIASEFSESWYIMVILGSLIQSLIIGVPLLIIVSDNEVASYFVWCGIIFVISCAVLGLMFGPKIVLVRSINSHDNEAENPTRKNESDVEEQPVEVVILSSNDDLQQPGNRTVMVGTF